jgi:hypothetical protein
LDEQREPSPLERFCAVLAGHGVEFIIVGGQAEALMGSARVTYDVDFCYRRTPENLERLATALLTLHLTLRGAPPDLKFRVDAQALALGQNYTFEVDGEYALDLLSYLEPLGTYEDVLPQTETVTIAGHTVRVIGLDDLIRIKKHLGRPRLCRSQWQTSQKAPEARSRELIGAVSTLHWTAPRAGRHRGGKGRSPWKRSPRPRRPSEDVCRRRRRSRVVARGPA